MKKILSIIIAAVMLCASLSVPVSAQEDALSDAFYDYCCERLGVGSTTDVRIIDTFRWGEITYFTATSWLAPGDMETYEVIGEYCVHSNVYQYPYELGVYVYANDEVYELKTAYDEGVIDSLYNATELDNIIMHRAGEDVELTHTCMDAFARYKNFMPEKDEYIDCTVYGELNDAVVFRAYRTAKDAVYADVCSEQRIGGYIFTYGYVIGPKDNPTGLYILKDGEVIPALEAYENGMLSAYDLWLLVGGEADPHEIESKIAEKLNLPPKDDTWEEPAYIYKEMYAYYSYPSSTSSYHVDYVLVHATELNPPPWIPSGRIGDFAVVSNAAGGETYGYYIYEPQTDTIYTLQEAVAVGVEGIENAFLHMGELGGIIGDADKDGKLTVRDATYIQKVLSGVDVENQNAYHEFLTELIRDFDRDDTVNIKDATAIQKWVAGLEF